jgi:hypothetical protein
LGNLRGPSHSSALKLLAQVTVYPERPLIDYLYRGVLGFPLSLLQKMLRWFPNSNFLLCASHVVGNPEGKRPLGRPRRRWVNNIKIYLREIGWDGGDWIGLAQDRDQWRAFVNAVMSLRVG